MGTLRRTCATAPQRSPLHKLLWADLLLSLLTSISSITTSHRKLSNLSGCSWTDLFCSLELKLNYCCMPAHLPLVEGKELRSVNAFQLIFVTTTDMPCSRTVHERIVNGHRLGLQFCARSICVSEVSKRLPYPLTGVTQLKHCSDTRVEWQLLYSRQSSHWQSCLVS